MPGDQSTDNDQGKGKNPNATGKVAKPIGYEPVSSVYDADKPAPAGEFTAVLTKVHK